MLSTKRDDQADPLASLAWPSPALPSISSAENSRRSGRHHRSRLIAAFRGGAKVAPLLRDLENVPYPKRSAIIIDYATTRGREEPVAAVITESTVQWLLHRRMNSQQQMRWSPRGAHLRLKVRASVVNGRSISSMPSRSVGRAARFGEQRNHPQVLDGLCVTEVKAGRWVGGRSSRRVTPPLRPSAWPAPDL